MGVNINSVLIEHNLTLSWEYDNIRAYTNGEICLYHSVSGSEHLVRMDYNETFDRWSTAFYSRCFNNLDKEMLSEISYAIEKIGSVKAKAIIEFIDEDGIKESRVDYNFLDSLCLEGV